MSTRSSVVKWFDAKKGYGFIEHPDNGGDIFVHYSAIADDKRFKTLKTGQEVEFELEDGPKGLHAKNVVGLGEIEDEQEEEIAAPASVRIESQSHVLQTYTGV